MVDRFNQKSDDEKIEFYSKVKNYLKDYAFLAQILPYEDTNLEKHCILLKKLIAKINPPRSEDLAKGILDNVSFDSYRVQLVKSEDIRLEGNGELLPSNADGSSKTQEAELQELSSIIKEFNEKYGNIEWGESDKVAQELIQVKNELSQNEKLKEIAHNTDKQNMQIKFKEILSEKFQDVAERNLVLFQQFNDNKDFKERITNKIFEIIYSEINGASLDSVY